MSEQGSAAAACAPTTEWRNFAAVFAHLRSPLRPAASDVARISDALGGARRLLLLGVTPELARLGETLVAVDGAPGMIARVWPGDDDRHHAILGDWTALPFADGAFDAVIGDGALNSAPGQTRPILSEVRRLLAPGGRAIFRTFCAPAAAETLDAIRADALGGRAGNVHALKWRIAMHLAAQHPDAIVPVRAILAAFDDLFPDRAALAAAAGWELAEIATLDAYRGAGHSLAFPTEAQLRALTEPGFASVATLPSSGYPLAERCPLLVCQAAG